MSSPQTLFSSVDQTNQTHRVVRAGILVLLPLIHGCLHSGLAASSATPAYTGFTTDLAKSSDAAEAHAHRLRQEKALNAVVLAREEADWMAPMPGDLSVAVAPKESRLFSVNAVELPIRLLLFSLVEQAGLELVLSDSSESTMTLRADEQPLSIVLDRVTREAGLRWTQTGNTIFVTSDTPYLKTYNVEYINISRSAKSSVGLATRVGSIALDDGSGGDSGGFSNNSQSLIENQSNHEFWESLQRDLQVLLQPVDVPFGQDTNPETPAAVNRDTGVVTVRATSVQHQQIGAYLQNIQTIASRQVLIEATIVEVTLSDRFQAGVDWTLSKTNDRGVSAAQVFHGQGEVGGQTINQFPAPSALLSAIHQSNSIGRLAATLSLLEGFGHVKILSRPQIIAINNQSAVLKVVDNRVYFTMSVEKQSSESGENSTTATDIHTVPVGLVMSVTPYVGSDNSVMLSVRPTISRILGFVSDPNPALAAANVSNGVPEIQVREMESVLKVGNGQIAMIGGLMQSERSEGDDRVPWVAEIPIVGSVFKKKSRSSRKTELLVFLQPTIIKG